MKKLILILFIIIGLSSCLYHNSLVSCEQIIIGIDKTDGYYCRYFFEEGHYILQKCGEFNVGDTIIVQKK